jgi:hypothetical protein
MGIKFGDLSLGVKITTISLSMLLIVSVCVGASNLYMDLKAQVNTAGSDIIRVESAHYAYVEKDEKWQEKTIDKIDEVEDDVNQIKLENAGLEIKYSEILRRLEKGELNDSRIIEKLDNLVRAE